MNNTKLSYAFTLTLSMTLLTLHVLLTIFP